MQDGCTHEDQMWNGWEIPPVHLHQVSTSKNKKAQLLDVTRADSMFLKNISCSLIKQMCTNGDWSQVALPLKNSVDFLGYLNGVDLCTP